MKTRTKRIVLAVLLVLSIANYARLIGSENVRNIQFLSIFVIGALSSLLLRDIVTSFRSKK
jgi:TM2 domain-containing membrane protein YozV